jgi:nitroreductase
VATGHEVSRTVVDESTPALEQVMRTRRSIRRFESRAVPEDLLLEILGLARHSPSSMGDQPWCFIVVRDRAILERLAEIKNHHCMADKRDLYPADFVASAPVAVVVCVARERAHSRERENGILVAGQILLAAHAYGLGGVYMTAYQPHDPVLEREIRGVLGIPPEVAPVALLPLGFPAEEPAPKQLRPLAELVHYESYEGCARR